MKNLFYAVLLICFCIYVYRKFCYKPRIKTVKIPTAKQVRRKKKRKRFKNKIMRIFRIPYKGKTEIIQYDKKAPYIESAWNEINKKKK